METTICPNEFLLDFSWLWFIVSVLISYGVGAMWYTFLFGKKWIKALKYECKCGARLVCIAYAGWTKSMLNFQVAEWKRYVTLVMIDVGYFVVVSAVFILFASL